MLKTITALPFATQYGTIEVPDGLSEEEERSYIEEHWGEIDFEEPELDYVGADFEVD